MPHPRIKGKIAMLYPLETLRGVLHSSHKERCSQPAGSDILDTYVPLLLARTGLDVITNKDILSGRAKHYKAIAMTGNLRIPQGTINSLKQYVENGGVLIMDFDSLSINDQSHGKNKFDELTGLTYQAANFAENGDLPTISIPELKISNGKLATRWLDKQAFVDITLVAAKTIATLSNGKAAVTVNTLGKGAVYFIGAKLPFELNRQFLASILRKHQINPDIDIVDKDGNNFNFVETAILKQTGKHVMYMVNWGKRDQYLVKYPGIPDGSYSIRNICTGNKRRTRNGDETWSADAIRKGFGLQLNNLSPVIWLIEKSDKKAALKIQDYVKNGGSLLLCGNGFSNYHTGRFRKNKLW